MSDDLEQHNDGSTAFGASTGRTGAPTVERSGDGVPAVAVLFRGQVPSGVNMVTSSMTFRTRTVMAPPCREGMSALRLTAVRSRCP